VPFGYAGDATGVVDQVERFAPGFRDRIIATVSKTTAELEDYTPTTSVATSLGAPTTGCRSSSARGWPSIRTRPGCRVCTCVRSPRRPAPGFTGCAATTPPNQRCGGCESRAGVVTRVHQFPSTTAVTSASRDSYRPRNCCYY
jgi:phytoene dehydrogenase-like protein